MLQNNNIVVGVVSATTGVKQHMFLNSAGGLWVGVAPLGNYNNQKLRTPMVYPPSGIAVVAIALAAALADAAVVAGNLAGIEALVVFIIF